MNVRWLQPCKQQEYVNWVTIRWKSGEAVIHEDSVLGTIAWVGNSKRSRTMGIYNREQAIQWNRDYQALSDE